MLHEIHNWFARWTRKMAGGFLLIGLMSAGAATNGPAEKVVPPPGLPDPLEPLNRVLWAVNKGLLNEIIQPTARVYRHVVVKPVRTGIANMGRNINYPGRVVNNALTGQWAGVRDETWRFLLNSTAGLAGFFDLGPAAGLPKWEADFGRTFARWGWRPDFYLMLPIYGPSSDRDTIGFAADSASNPLLFLEPYDLNWRNPLTYFGPYSYFSYLVTYNNLSDSADTAACLSKSDMDPHSFIAYAYSFARDFQTPVLQVAGAQDTASLDTLGSIFFNYKDPEFYSRSTTAQALIPATGRKLPFTYWMRPGRAPVLYLVPGLCSHRLASTATALAELAYNNGFSVVIISNPFHTEFIDAASSVSVPAYLPVDGADLRAALTEVARRMDEMFPGRTGRKALMGYSMGAFETLYLGATRPKNEAASVEFDRYVAIDTPVRLMHGVSMLDSFYSAPLQWPAASRTANMKNTLLKVAALSEEKGPPSGPLPFSGVESQFLVGLTFRFNLRDMIYDTQKREDLGVLRRPLHDWHRAPAYREIIDYGFQDYFDQFVVPYYDRRGMGDSAAEELDKAGDLHTYEPALAANADLRVIVNDNDFLNTDADRAWLKSTLGPQRLKVFNRGGHLGNLGQTNVQSAIIAALDGLK